MNLVVENLSYGPGELTLASGLNFTLRSGELLHLTGDNGTGKSFLARTLLGLSPAKTGTIHLECETSRYLPQLQNRASHLPYSLGEILGHSASFSLIEENRLSLAWNKASGGERQRVLLSRFFSQPGDFLVMDEPFNHLDSAAKEKVRMLLRETLEKNPRAAVLLISHDDNPASWLKIPVRTLHLSERGEAL